MLTDGFYVYTLAYPSSMGGEVFYVGKSKSNRNRLKQHYAEARSGIDSPKCDAIRSILEREEQVVEHRVAFFEGSKRGEIAAYKYEAKLIAEIGVDKLANIAEGGMGNSGRKAKHRNINVSFAGTVLNSIYDYALEQGVALPEDNAPVVMQYIRDLMASLLAEK